MEKRPHPRNYREQSKSATQKVIEEGYGEYLSYPRHKGEVYPHLAAFFETEITENPIRRQDIEKEVERYVEQNFEKILPLFFLTSFNNQRKFIEQLGLTNEQIAFFRGNYHIHTKEKNGEPETSQTDEYHPEGSKADNYYPGITETDFLTMGYAKDNIRLDTQSVDKVEGKVARRFYFKPAGRYLCKNDFGMRLWSEKERKMIEGDVENVTPFIKTIEQQFLRIQDNLLTLTYTGLDNLYTETVIEIQKEIPMPKYEDFENPNEYDKEMEKYQQKVNNIASTRTAKKLLKHFEQYPGDKKLILESIPFYKVEKRLHFQLEHIARKYGLITDGEPVAEYNNFRLHGHEMIKKIIREPNDDEKTGTTLKFIYFFKKTAIVENDIDLIGQTKNDVKDILAYNAAQSDEKIKNIFERLRYSRGKQSPFFYNDYQLYDFIRACGPKRAEQVLDVDSRDISKQMTGYTYIQAMGYDISRFEPSNLRKQLYEANKLDSSLIWEYIQKKEEKTIEKAKAKLGDKAIGKHWLELLGRRKARALFREGKRMYWFAQQIYMKNTHREHDRFYRHNFYGYDWGLYDLAKLNLPEEKLNEYLNKHINLIVALLNQDQNMAQDQYAEVPGAKSTSVSLGLIFEALKTNQNLKGVAIAQDKRRYLEGIIKNEITDDLEFALQDWPDEWKKAISKEEVSLYYEYSSDYLQIDPNGLAKYATWRATPEGKEWAKIFTETPKQKNDLDFRICLSGQTEEVRGWYKNGAEYVGNKTMQTYLMRFNATRDTNGQIANWHDVLYWIPNITKLTVADAKSVLSTIQTMDDNAEFIKLLPRYDAERDPLKKRGRIESVRELKKRVLAIESDIDLSTLPDDLVNIALTTPGFDLSALERMRRKRTDFQDLMKGKLDEKQPFKPHTIIFPDRPLTAVLAEALGSREKEIKGTAKSPKKLYKQLNQLIKGRTIDEESGERKMQIKDLLNKVPIDLEEKILSLLQQQNVNVDIVEAQIHAKSDPKGWVCGNYTDCCMSFGTSTNTDYMFNLSTQYFTVAYNGRIVAQSVVVDAENMKDGTPVVILDNIEVAKNYKQLSPQIAKAYQKFWSEYTSKPVKIGIDNSDLTLPGSKLQENTYQPKTRLTCSDSRGPYIYDFPRINVESIDEKVTFTNITLRDVNLIAEMEKKVYPEGMVQGEEYIKSIIESQIQLNTPGMASSFIIRKGSEAAGYVLMLMEPSGSEITKFTGKKIIHIYDMVVLPKFQKTGLAKKAMEHIIDVAKAYQISFEAEARETTSYKILMKESVREWLKSQGFHLRENRTLPEYLGNENFHFVLFENRRDENV